MSPKHSPAKFEHYLQSHQNNLEQFYQEGFVCCDTLSFEDFGEFVELKGEIGCIGGIIISVCKVIEYVDEEHVQTCSYAYNVRKLNKGTWFRYDDAHAHEGHSDEHHKDVYDPETGVKELSEWVGENDWPHLSDVIREAQEFAYKNKHLLDDPSECVDQTSLSDDPCRHLSNS